MIRQRQRWFYQRAIKSNGGKKGGKFFEKKIVTIYQQ